VTSSRASGFNPPGSAEWHLLAGDSSAIPAIATILSAQPDLGISAIVEVDDLLDAQALPTSARDGIQFVVREPEQISGAALLDALLGHRTPAGGGFVWIAAEALIIRQARLQLAGRFDRHSLVTRGYWRAGQVNHPDHDDGTENLA
jgi:NADPH-dependent ferric siderophore reductase